MLIVVQSLVKIDESITSLLVRRVVLTDNGFFHKMLQNTQYI